MSEYDDALQKLKDMMDPMPPGGNLDKWKEEYIKKLLAPETFTCQYCHKTFDGTEQDNEKHVVACQMGVMQKELDRQKELEDARRKLKDELRKLI